MIDTHSHLNFQAFRRDYREIIKRSFTNGIKAIINVGSNFATSQRAIEIAKEFSNCYSAVGLHPIHVKDEKFDFEKFKNLIRNYSTTCPAPNLTEKFLLKKNYFLFKIVIYLLKLGKFWCGVNANSGVVKAIGETGLDYFHLDADKRGQDADRRGQTQKEVFLKHLDLAKEFNLPVILHCRGSEDNPKQAYEDLLEILRISVNPRFDDHRTQRKSASGVIHCFSSDWQIAQQFLGLGFLIGFTGVITFDNASDDLLEAVAKTPIDKILIETDCPFLAPQPVRGQRCEPWHVKFTAEKIAEIKKIPVEQVFEITTANARRLFQV